MIKILFLIHDLGRGGAERVLVNLVNHMDRSRFDISVTVLFGGGINERFLSPDIRFRALFPQSIPGNRRWMKLLSPAYLHRLSVREHYDIEVSYLEGPSARVLSGCQDPDTRLVCWIHCMHPSKKSFARSFRSLREARACYRRFDRIIGVSRSICENFQELSGLEEPCQVLYNTIDSERILALARKKPAVDPFPEFGSEPQDSPCPVSMITAGTMKEVKGYERLLRIVLRLKEENFRFRLSILGDGPLREKLEQYVRNNRLQDTVSFPGYQTNPYPCLKKGNLYVCSSFSEGFSTAVAEALILGLPVCTTDVSGMKEMLGENNEYGIVTENSEEALYEGLRALLDNPELLAFYTRQARIRGAMFSTASTVSAVEEMFESLRKH